MHNRAGQYKSFLPNPLPPNPKFEIDEDMMALLIKANSSVAKLDEISTMKNSFQKVSCNAYATILVTNKFAKKNKLFERNYISNLP